MSHFETVCVCVFRGKKKKNPKKQPTKPKDFPEERFAGETEQITGYCQGLFCLHSSVNDLLGQSGIFFLLSLLFVLSF